MSDSLVVVEEALTKTRAARNAAWGAKEDRDLGDAAVGMAEKAHQLILEAEGLLAMARYFASKESDK